MATLLAACHAPGEPAPRPADSPFQRPQALAFAGPYLTVANSAFEGDGVWGPGSLVVLDPATGALVNHLPTTARNPQRVRVTGTDVLVLQTGDFAVGDEVLATSDGALDRFPIATLAEAAGPAGSVAIPTGAAGRLGAPVDFVVGPDALVVSSGLAGATWRIADEALHAPNFYAEAGALGLGSVARWAGHTLLVDFNSDRLHVLDAAGRARCGFTVGANARAVEGAQSLVVHGDHAYFILALAGTVGRVSLDRMRLDDPDCGAPPVETVISPAGAVPNDLHVRGDRIYLVDSGENQVVAYDLSGDRQARWALPLGSNPWHMAFSPDGRHFAVTAWLADAVVMFDVERSDPLWWAPLAPDAAAVELGRRGDADHADLVDAPTRPGAFGDPARAANGVQGAGEFAGGTDVYAIPPGEALVLGWSGRRLVDGPGADLVVFENPFRYSGGVFMDPVVVEVSPDGERWVAFEHGYLAPDPTAYSADPAHWRGFAGVTPTRYADPEADPFGLAAGGDRFDLADLPTGDVATEIRRDGVAAVRLSAASDWLDPNTGAPYPADPASDGPDIDGVFGRRFRAD